MVREAGQSATGSYGSAQDSAAPTAHHSLLTAAPSCAFPGLPGSTHPCRPSNQQQPPPRLPTPPARPSARPPATHLQQLRLLHGISLDCRHHHFPLKGVVHSHHPGLPLQHQVGVGLAIPAVPAVPSSSATGQSFSCVWGQAKASTHQCIGCRACAWVARLGHRWWAFQGRRSGSTIPGRAATASAAAGAPAARTSAW